MALGKFCRALTLRQGPLSRLVAGSPMKITASNRLSTSSIGQGGRQPPGGSFSVPDAEESAAGASATRASSVSSLSSLEALIALQQVDEPLSRRRRAVARAGRLLDGLDQVKLAMLDGDPAPEPLLRLAAAVREQRVGADEPGLQALLDQIETRALVELAKLEVANRRG